ncbi:hypothetical protein CEQ07_05205 [Oligella urethralis]|uniref:DUF3168 domain-containing protein n=1 Tax=Oligella urethralis TaxID=90245 RepID=UPI000CFFA64E|nr:DUF3168 domain-containing protein [Oligella urethralis]AVL70866.1 hypothetical protein CEQ07_05205 [Oligella urethralis]
MFPPVHTIVMANQAAQALGLTIYPVGHAPQDVAKPYAVWQIISGAPENYIGDRPNIDSYNVQFDVYAKTVTTVRECAKAIRDAIEGHAHITSWLGESREDDTKLYRVSFDADFFVQR